MNRSSGVLRAVMASWVSIRRFLAAVGRSHERRKGIDNEMIWIPSRWAPKMMMLGQANTKQTPKWSVESTQARGRLRGGLKVIVNTRNSAKSI